jgi:hypothetical protein
MTVNHRIWLAKAKIAGKKLALVSLGVVIGVSYTYCYFGGKGLVEDYLGEKIVVYSSNGSLVSAGERDASSGVSGAEMLTDGGGEQSPPSREDTVKEVAAKYAIDWKILWSICTVESNCNPDRIGDSGNSYGAFQIYLPAHPDITKEQAMDFEWAAEWTAKHGMKYKDSPKLFAKNHNGIGKTTNDWYVERVMNVYELL